MALLKRLQGKLLCLEQLILAFLDRLGLAVLRTRVCPFRAIDKVMAAVFGSTCQAPEHDVREGLRSYIAALERMSGSLLASLPIA